MLDIESKVKIIMEVNDSYHLNGKIGKVGRIECNVNTNHGKKKMYSVYVDGVLRMFFEESLKEIM